jgi:hypothetical protein
LKDFSWGDEPSCPHFTRHIYVEVLAGGGPVLPAFFGLVGAGLDRNTQEPSRA